MSTTTRPAADDFVDQTLVIEATEPLKILNVGGDGVAKVGSYAVRFSGPEQKDLHGEFFTKNTDFGPRNGDGVATMFNHGMPLSPELDYLAFKTFAPVKTLKDDVGIFVETVLSLSDEYEAAIADLVQAGKLKWSSGTSYHMARKTKEGEILRWHPIEFSYTPTPAESRLPAIMPLKSVIKGEITGEAWEPLKAVWSTAYINNLPDSAFLYVESGGKKDSEGKTVPRTLRHLPYKDASGSIDLPHLRNALARIPQSNLPQSVKDRLTAAAKRILAKQNKSVFKESAPPDILAHFAQESALIQKYGADQFEEWEDALSEEDIAEEDAAPEQVDLGAQTSGAQTEQTMPQEYPVAAPPATPQTAPKRPPRTSGGFDPSLLTRSLGQMNTAEEKLVELEATLAKNVDLHRAETAEKDSKIAEIAAENARLREENAKVPEQIKARALEISEMYALGYQFGQAKIAREFVEKGATLAEFRKHLLEELKATPVILDVSIDAADIAKRLEEIKNPEERTEFYRKNREAIRAANRQLKVR